jgi:hypothetical protein
MQLLHSLIVIIVSILIFILLWLWLLRVPALEPTSNGCGNIQFHISLDTNR